MKKKTCKIIICMAMIVMLFTSLTNVFAATNPDYTKASRVVNDSLESKIKSNVLLDLLASCINAVASIVEWLVGAVFKILTGDEIFPWADRIIFNGIAFLDINFLNPSSNSLFGSLSSPSILGEVVKQVYSTIFSLAVLFLGVAIGIMAIRLAISSIASEKAKYKQAIVNWVTCIVMLFCMHYILAFVFWINEQLVRMASGILIQTIKDKGLDNLDFSQALSQALDPEKRLENFLSTANDVTDERRNFFKNNIGITNNLLSSSSYQYNRMVYISDSSDEWQDNFARFWAGEAENNKIGMYRLEKDVIDAKGMKDNIDQAENDLKNNGYYQSTNTKLWLDKEKYMQSDDFLNDLKDVLLFNSNVAMYGDEVKIELEKNPERKINLMISPNFWSSAASFALRNARTS